MSAITELTASSTASKLPELINVNVTCSHEIIDKSRHAVPRFSLKTVVGVNLGEIEIFALCRSSFIFTPYTCSFLLYSTHKYVKFCKWSTYWSIRHREMTPKWPIFTEGLLSVTRAEPPCIGYQNKGHGLKMWAIDMVVWNHPIERRVWAKFGVNKAQRVNQSEAEYKNSLGDCTTTRL